MTARWQPSHAFIQFSESRNFGRAFAPDASVWSRYFESSFSRSNRRWNSLRGVRNRAGYSFQFELGLTENKALPNAVCSRDQVSHYILIYHTLPMFLFEFFNRLLCSREIIEEVGDAQREISCEQKGFHSPPGFGIMFGEAQIRHFDEIADVFGPRSPERLDLAHRLFQYAMEFVLEHEMAHAVNGHVHYAQEEFRLQNLDEIAFRSFGEREAKHRLYAFFEGMADKGSYFTVVNDPILERMHTPFQVLSSGDTELISEVQFKILAGAFLAVFWMISDVLREKGDIKAVEIWDDHPSSLARAIAFALVPKAQTSILPDEIRFFVDRGSSLAWKELLKQSEINGLFRPFRWLGREDMYSSIFQSNVLSEDESRGITDKLRFYRYVSNDRETQNFKG
jgi:hypothetical protein